MGIVRYQLGEFKLRVLPEAYTVHPMFLAKKGFVSIGGISNKRQEVWMVDDKGRVLDKRAKVVLTNREINIGYEIGLKDEFRAFRLGKYRILSVICYEICSPEIWKKVESEIDLVTHHIAFPMYDKRQAHRWKKLQIDMSRYFTCDVVCSTGDINGRGKIDLSGVIHYGE